MQNSEVAPTRHFAVAASLMFAHLSTLTIVSCVIVNMGSLLAVYVHQKPTAESTMAKRQLFARVWYKSAHQHQPP